MKVILASLLAWAMAWPVLAGPANIAMVKITGIESSMTIEVVLKHDDDGWEHYADSVAIFTTAGEKLANVAIKRPHAGHDYISVRLNNLDLPEGTEALIIKGNCSIDGWVGQPVTVSLR